MVSARLSSLFWIAILLLGAYIVADVLSGPPTGLRVGMLVTAAVAVVLLILERLVSGRAS